MYVNFGVVTTTRRRTDDLKGYEARGGGMVVCKGCRDLVVSVKVSNVNRRFLCINK